MCLLQSKWLCWIQHRVTDVNTHDSAFVFYSVLMCLYIESNWNFKLIWCRQYSWRTWMCVLAIYWGFFIFNAVLTVVLVSQLQHLTSSFQSVQNNIVVAVFCEASQFNHGQLWTCTGLNCFDTYRFFIRIFRAAQHLTRRAV